MKRLLLIPFIIIFSTGCKKSSKPSLPYFNTSDFTPVWLKKTDPEFKKLHTVPSFSFTDQNGHTITDQTTAGKIYVANFFFTRCENICPRMMDNMKKAANVFANDSSVLIISHSVTPLYDNTAVLKKYADDKNITSPNWHLVTGDKDNIYKLAREGYFADTVTSSAITSQFLHTENFILVDKNRHIRGVYNGTIELEVDNLIRHIKMLKEED
jgi:protein SCO1/2